MKKNIRQLLRIETEKDRKLLMSSMDNVVKEDFQNPQAILKRIEKNVSQDNLIKLSRYYVDDFVRTIKTFTIKMHVDNVQAYFHKHDFIELIYVLEGECRQYIGNMDKIVVLKQNQAMIINYGTVHAILPSKNEDIIIKMFIPRDYLYTTSNIFNGESFNSKIRYYTFTVTGESIRKIDCFLDGLIEDYFENRLLKSNALKSYLTLIIIELFRGESIYNNISEDIDQRILNFIELEYRYISLKGLSAHFGYSEKYMSRLVKDLFGTSFIKLRNSIRLKKGLFYLLNTEMPIDEIAHQLGFQNSSNFYRLTNNELGITPNQIRKDGRKK